MQTFEERVIRFQLPWMEFGSEIPILSKEEFVAKYIPKYQNPYKFNYGLEGFKLRKNSCYPVDHKPSHNVAQQTKRDRFVEAVYQRYLSIKNSESPP